MSERDPADEAPAPGNWRVTAQPFSAATARAGSEPGAIPPPAPGRTGGRPLIATAICVGVLLLSLAGQDQTPIEARGPGSYFGYILGGAVFGAILWGVAFAITIRKASTGWKAGSLIAVALLGGLVALNRVVNVGTGTASAPTPASSGGK